MLDRPFIGVIGAGAADDKVSSEAEEVGFLIARRGGVLLCGGLEGVMEACCKGAKRGDGLTIGILPGDNSSQANPYVDIPIVTGLSHARNILIVRSSHVLIAVSGGYGTLSEIAFALKMGKPVVGLGTWKIECPVHETSTPAEAVAKAWNLLNKKEHTR